jgi:hypothetical protein
LLVVFSITHPNYGFVALDIAEQQHYYTAVGNVLGNPNLHHVPNVGLKTSALATRLNGALVDPPATSTRPSARRIAL